MVERLRATFSIATSTARSVTILGHECSSVIGSW